MPLPEETEGSAKGSARKKKKSVPGKMNKLSKLPSADTVSKKVNQPPPPKLIKMGQSSPHKAAANLASY